MYVFFSDRADAGRQLADHLMAYAGKPGVLVLGLPRGGVPVASAVAHALGVPLDVFSARKLPLPGHEELAMGAVASGDVCVMNEEIVTAFNVPPAAVARVIAETTAEVARREKAYRGDRPPVDVHGSDVILVDDGIATGATVRAAVTALKAQHAHRVIVAAPVATRESIAAIERLADDVVVLLKPAHFIAVGAWYEEFPQLDDDDVRTLLERTAETLPDEARLAARLAARRRAHVA